MRKLRGTVIIAASAALIAAGVLAGTGSAGTSGIGAGNIVFAGVDPSDGMSDIYVMKTDGTEKTNITQDQGARKDLEPELSPDGKRIVFTRSTAGGSSIMLVNADGSGLTYLTSPPSLTKTSNVNPNWSRDGTRVVFASNRDGNFDLYWLALGNDQVHRLTKTSAPVQNLDPAWSPNGDAIVFSRSGHRPAVSIAAAELFQLKVASLVAARLTRADSGQGDRGAVYSPNGNDIAFHSDRAGNDDVYVLHLAGSYLQRVTNSLKPDKEPSYAPDGSALAFVSARSGATEIWAQNLLWLSPSPSQPVQITKDGQTKSHPSWGRVATQPVPNDVPPAPVAASSSTPVAAAPVKAPAAS